MKYFSFRRGVNDILATLLIVIVLIAAYFYVYIPQNERRVQEQRFRALQNIDRNVHAKIENSLALLNNLLQSYQNDDTQSISYANTVNKNNFSLSIITSQNAAIAGGDSIGSIQVNSNARKITLFSDAVKNSKTNAYHKMEMVFSFEQFIRFLLPENVFDQYVVLSDGHVVYEDFPSGIGTLNDSLSGKKSGIVSSGIKSLNVSGQDYKLFFQPISLAADKQLVITGLLSDKHYQQEKNQLPSQVLLLLLTIVFVAMLAYPWIKLYQMGNTDRLTVTDGVASFVVSMLLMSLLIFSFFKYNFVFRPATIPDSKDTLARQIKTAFTNEIDSAYKKLHLFNSFMEADSSHYFKDILNLDKDSITYKDGDKDKGTSLASLRTIAKNISIDRVFWLDENGMEKKHWITANVNSPYGNFSKREYFQHIIKNEPYLLNNNAASPFYLDQVISWTSGVFNSVLSIPSKVPGLKVACISFDMLSLQRPLLPVGYQFACIDNSGKVLYHSDPSHNLNENLLNEFSANEALSSSIQARVKATFTTNYYSRLYTVTVEPISNLPYFMVVFEDASFKETMDVEIYSFTFSIMLLMFLFLICQLLSIFIVSSKRSFFKKQLFDTSWVGPKISSYGQYNISTLANTILIILAALFYPYCSVLSYVFILLFSITFSSVFLNSLFAKRYKKNRQHGNYWFKIRSICCLCGFVVIINIAAIRTLEGASMLIVWLYELVAFLIGWLLFAWGKLLLNKVYKLANSRFLSYVSYAHSFALMVLTRLLLTSGLPILFFYLTSYNFEQNIGSRYRQLQYANGLPATLNSSQATQLINTNRVANRYYYYDGAWIKSLAFSNKDSVKGYIKEEHITVKLLSLFHINISDKAVKENKFSGASATDSSFFYNPLLSSAIKTNGITTTYLHNGQVAKDLAISSASLNYRLPVIYGKAFYTGWLFWLLLLVGLIIFYFIIYNIIGKIFCLKLPDLSMWDAWDDVIIKNPGINNLLFVIGLPGSGKLARIKEKIQKGEMPNSGEPFVISDDEAINNVVIADLINIPDFGEDREKDPAWEVFINRILNPKNQLIIINHFEYNIRDAVTNRIKLNLLERIMLDNKSKAIILSTIHPVAFLDSVTDQLASDKAPTGQDLERWHVLFGHFRIVVFPLQMKVINKKHEAYKTIYKETAYTHFLNNMQQAAIEVAATFPTNEKFAAGDEMVFKLQVTAHYFYMYIWQSLTKEEKFLLYDLAEDNLVNSFDDYNLNMLLAKGVIIKVDGSLTLFNKGFRNFILTAIGNTEAKKIKGLMQDTGNWSKLKNPLVIIIAAILIFLLASQEEAYSKLITYVATLGAGIPTIIKLFSLFDKSDSAK